MTILSLSKNASNESLLAPAVATEGGSNCSSVTTILIIKTDGKQMYETKCDISINDSLALTGMLARMGGLIEYLVKI